jgi:hypothetical protein
MENISMNVQDTTTTAHGATAHGATAGGAPAPAPPKLTQIPVDNQNVALNLLINFVNLAQRRGAYTLDEAAKIWECVKMFQ